MQHLEALKSDRRLAARVYDYPENGKIIKSANSFTGRAADIQFHDGIVGYTRRKRAAMTAKKNSRLTGTFARTLEEKCRSARTGSVSLDESMNLYEKDPYLKSAGTAEAAELRHKKNCKEYRGQFELSKI